MKYIKKITALILAMLMVFAVSPAAFAQDEDNTEDVPAAPVAAWFNSFGINKGTGTIDEAFAAVTANGRIDLLGNAVIKDEIVISKDVTVDGKGFTITRDAEYLGVMFVITNGAKVTFNGVVVDGNSEEIHESTERMITVADGVLKLTNKSVLQNNFASYSVGGAVKVGTDSSTGPECALTMNGGSSITNCTASVGGALAVGQNSTFTMLSSSISQCAARTDGGAIEVLYNSSTVNIANSEITKNEASAQTSGAGSAIDIKAGRVSVADTMITDNENFGDKGAVSVTSDAELTIGGSTVVYGNTGSDSQSNIFIKDGAVITISPEFTDGAKLGISTEKGYSAGDSIDFIVTDCDITGFVYNDPDGMTFYVSNGNVILLECITVTFNAGNGVCEVKSKIYPVDIDFGYLPTPEERDGFDFLGWYTANDVLITEDSPVSFYKDITLYAKWENLNKLDNNPLAVIGRFFERIANLMRIAFQFLSNLFNGGGDKGLEGLK